jgi:hypothetical protein
MSRFVDNAHAAATEFREQLVLAEARVWILNVRLCPF